jgi:hypothetical protein
VAPCPLDFSEIFVAHFVLARRVVFTFNIHFQKSFWPSRPLRVTIEVYRASSLAGAAQGLARGLWQAWIDPDGLKPCCPCSGQASRSFAVMTSAPLCSVVCRQCLARLRCQQAIKNAGNHVRHAINIHLTISI